VLRQGSGGCRERNQKTAHHSWHQIVIFRAEAIEIQCAVEIIVLEVETFSSSNKWTNSHYHTFFDKTLFCPEISAAQLELTFMISSQAPRRTEDMA